MTPEHIQVSRTISQVKPSTPGSLVAGESLVLHRGGVRHPEIDDSLSAHRGEGWTGETHGQTHGGGVLRQAATDAGHAAAVPLPPPARST